jgi:hypothetical protein
MSTCAVLELRNENLALARQVETLRRERDQLRALLKHATSEPQPDVPTPAEAPPPTPASVPSHADCVIACQTTTVRAKCRPSCLKCSA